MKESSDIICILCIYVFTASFRWYFFSQINIILLWRWSVLLSAIFVFHIIIIIIIIIYSFIMPPLFFSPFYCFLALSLEEKKEKESIFSQNVYTINTISIYISNSGE